MTPALDISTHPLRSDVAKDLAAQQPAAFEAVATAAETMLGLGGYASSAANVETARLALVYTVNAMVALDGSESVLESQSMGEGRQVKYRDNPSIVPALALTLVQGLGIWPPVLGPAPVVEPPPCFRPSYRC